MEIHTFLIFGHILAVVLGVGGATMSDLTLFRALKDRKLDSSELAILTTLSKAIWTGLSLAFLTGAGLLTLQYLNLGELPLLADPRFQMKVTAVLAVLLNGIAFHTFVFPMMKRHVDQDFLSGEVGERLWLFALTGAISVTSWYTTLILGIFTVINLPYLLLLNIYLLIVFLGAFSGYFFLQLKLGVKLSEINKKPIGLLFVLLGLVALVAGFGTFNQMEKTPSLVSDGKTHYVCITETAPWFHSEVLEIEKGDTVVWHHCQEDEAHQDHATGHSFLREAHAHSGHGHGHVHTHPIVSISGPEEFGSDLRPIGHLENGEEYRFTFTKEGVYEYICPTHPYMKGIIAVGVDAPTDSLWPPDEGLDPDIPLSPPSEAGVGEIWVNTQFERIPGQDFPGTITIIDAGTWEITDVISDNTFNNPHNLWNTSDGQYMFQTQWHSDGVSKIDIETKEILGTVSVGNAPAHIFPHPNKDRVYVTLNNEPRVAILDTDLNHIGNIETSFGAHGIWIDPSGKWMSVAATLQEKLDIIDLETEEVVATFDAPGLPLATQITNDGRYAMISLLLEGKVRFIDLETMEMSKDVEVGVMPIWAVHDPTNEYILVPNTGSANISVIDYETLEVVKTIPAAAGAHGITFGEKENGGYYGYFSNKFARVVGVIDMETLETVGYIPLGENQWGGNAILVMPNYYDRL